MASGPAGGGLWVDVRLPEDLTARESARLGQWVALLGQVALAMAALVAWGDWLPGRGRPLSTGADRGTLRRWLRDNDPATLGPVRVLDLRRSAPGEDQRGTHASPTPHLRRGHYRRVAVGEGRAGREWRWIAPTVVGGELADDRTVTVWRLPEP